MRLDLSRMRKLKKLRMPDCAGLLMLNVALRKNMSDGASGDKEICY